MTEFKVGDRVINTNTSETAVVTESTDDYIDVEWDEYKGFTERWRDTSHFEMVFRKDARPGLEPSADGTPEYDAVNHPSHYNAFPGVEVIELTQHLNFCKGNAVKYLARAGLKDPAKEIEDLRKAIWYVEREIARLEALSA